MSSKPQNFMDFIKLQAAPPVAPPAALVGPHDAAGAYHRAISGTPNAALDDSLGTRKAAASWAHGLAIGATADAEQIAELERIEAQRRQQARDAMQTDLPATRCY